MAEQDARDLHLTISGAHPGLPLTTAGFLLSAINLAYPNAMLTSARVPGGFEVRIPATDLYAAPDAADSEQLAALVPAPGDEQTTAFLDDLRSGDVGIALPPWLATLLTSAAEQLAEAVAEVAPNYLDMTFEVPRHGQHHWIVCRPGRPTPHELRQAAETRVAALEQQLREHGIEPLPVAD